MFEIILSNQRMQRITPTLQQWNPSISYERHTTSNTKQTAPRLNIHTQPLCPYHTYNTQTPGHTQCKTVFSNALPFHALDIQRKSAIHTHTLSLSLDSSVTSTAPHIKAIPSAQPHPPKQHNDSREKRHPRLPPNARLLRHTQHTIHSALELEP